MTPDDLRRLTSLYARYIRLTKTTKRPSAGERSEAYLVRLELEELGFDPLKDRSPQEP